MHVPAGYDPARPVPLVLAFHGGGGHAAYIADDARYGLVAKAEREGFVVAFPNGYSRFPRGRLATWNAGGCCGEARDRAVDDVGFVRAVVARVKSRVAIDGARVFAAGMSNGGMLAHRLACEAPDVFRAVASVAGTDATANCAPSRPASVLHIHARNDTHVLFTGGAGEDAFRHASEVMDFVSVLRPWRWVKRNQCGPVPASWKRRAPTARPTPAAPAAFRCRCASPSRAATLAGREDRPPRQGGGLPGHRRQRLPGISSRAAAATAGR